MKQIIKYYDQYGLKVLVAFLIIFTALYPKLPSVHIVRTWVYIRLEDFFILGTAVLWFIQLVRKKVTFPVWLGGSIGAYWAVGLVSLIYSILFIGPTLQGFFPHVAALQYLRRIEYMILFFVAFSTIKSKKDIRDYFIVLSATVFGILLYGFGQKYYFYLWAAYPDFFQKYSFCFPSFQTGNEEFAKGIPLCLPKEARLTSTFGGHYDLAAYLVFVIPIFLAVSISVKKWSVRILTFLLYIGTLILLLLTSSRTSYLAYLAAVVAMLIIYRKKLFIIPVLILSIALLLTFSGSTANRLMQTLRISSIITNDQGQVIGQLPENLKEKITTEEELARRQQELQPGTITMSLPTNVVATNTATIEKKLSREQMRKLRLNSNEFQISTVSGNFYIKKVLVADISLTTRFQAEWPNAWNAYQRNPLLGSGYSTITLATDGDYLRALGESGFLGLFAFTLIFILLWVTFKDVSKRIESPFIRGFLFGMVGGVIGLALNAILIDVFEASKVAENLWLLLGISAGGITLYKHQEIAYAKHLKRILFSNAALLMYALFALITVYLSWLGNFFAGKDYSLLRQAAVTTPDDLMKLFGIQNLFSGPITGLLTFYLYNLFSFQPQGYHVVLLILHCLAGIAGYFIALKLLKNKLLAFLTTLLFLLYPGNADDIFYFTHISIPLVSVFILYAALTVLKARENKSVVHIVLTVILLLLALFSYQLLPVFYLGSFLISLLLVWVLQTLIFKFIKDRKLAMSVITIFAVLLSFWFISRINIIKNDWNKAGEITRNTLTNFRLDYEMIDSASNLYFVNTPAIVGNSPVFGENMKEALWFIYQQKMPHINEVKTLEEARENIKNKNTKNNYIFRIDENGELKEVR